MISPLSSLIAITSLLATTSAQATEAPACIPEENAQALILYVLPSAIKTAQSKCSTALPPEASLLQTNNPQFQKYLKASAASWDGAKDAFAALAGDKLPEGVDIDAMRPLFDVMIPAMLENEIKTEHCETINHVYDLLEPLPAENLGGLTIFFAKLGGKDDKESKFNICKVPA